jgi:predicted transcriptional regulator
VQLGARRAAIWSDAHLVPNMLAIPIAAGAVSSYNQAMSIHLRPDQETHLQEIAARSGRDPNQLAQEAVDDLIEYDAWYRQQVAEGFAQLDRGEFVTHEEVGARLARLFRS